MESQLGAGASLPPPTLSNPFKFLDYYTDSPEDRLRFGGREREIREIVARVTNEPLLVLYGRSGIGKTSLLLAGVFPELVGRGHRPVYVRTLTSPRDDLGRALGRACKPPEEWRGDLELPLRTLLADGPLVVVFDQFEEFFIRFAEGSTARAELSTALMRLNQEPDASLVFSLREDYLAQVDELRGALPAIVTNQYRLRPLTAYGVRQAILKPLVEAGIPYEEPVISKLVDQLAEFGYDPPVLQIICTELFREAARRAGEERPRITLDDLHRVGGLAGIFRRYLDAVTQAIPAERHLLARMVLDALITRESTKQAARESDILQAGFSAGSDEVAEVLEILTVKRLLRRDEREGEAWYELIHERLVPYVREWLDLDRQFFEFRQARTFVRNNSDGDLWRRNPDALLNPGVLSGLIGRYQQRFRFDTLQLEFVLRSAIFQRSDAVRFWAERFGLSPTVDLLLALSETVDSRERTGASAAAAALSESADKLAPVLLRLALHDASEEVRHAAGRSLARLARGADLEDLRLALRAKATRVRAKETLVEMSAAGHSLHHFSWFRRQLAKYRAERRQLHERREILQARAKSGAVSGLIVGILWLVTVGAVLSVPLASGLDDWIFDPIGSTIKVALYVLTSLIGIVPLGIALGWLAARIAARDAILHGEGQWLLAGWRFARLPTAVVCVIALFSVAAPTVLGALTTTIGCFSYLAVAVLVPVGVVMVLVMLGCLFARPLRVCLWPNSSSRELWTWSIVGSAGLPVLLPVLVLTAVAKIHPAWKEALGPITLLLTAATCSLATCVTAAAIARSAQAKPQGELPLSPPPRQKRYRRIAEWTATVALLLLLFTFAAVFLFAPS